MPFPSFLSSFKNWSSSVRSNVHPVARSWKTKPDPFLLFFFCYRPIRPRPEDPDVEDAPVVPDMGTIELRAFRSRALRIVDNHQLHAPYGLHRGRVSERSKKAGWHHVR